MRIAATGAALTVATAAHEATDVHPAAHGRLHPCPEWSDVVAAGPVGAAAPPAMLMFGMDAAPEQSAAEVRRMPLPSTMIWSINKRRVAAVMRFMPKYTRFRTSVEVGILHEVL